MLYKTSTTLTSFIIVFLILGVFMKSFINLCMVIMLVGTLSGCGSATAPEQNSALASSIERGASSLETDFRFVIKKGLSGEQVVTQINTILLSALSLPDNNFQCIATLSEIQKSAAYGFIVFANLECTATSSSKVTYGYLNNVIAKMSAKSGYKLDVPSQHPLPNIGVSN